MRILLTTLFLFVSFSSFSTGKYELQLKAGKFTPSENYENELRFKSNRKASYKIIQFYTTPDRSAQDRISGLGVELMDYLPLRAFIARIPEGFSYSSLAGFGIRSIIPFENRFKADDRYLGEVPDFCSESGKRIRLSVILYDDNRLSEFLQDLSKVEGEFHAEKSIGGIHEVVIPNERREDLLELANVKWVEFGEGEPIEDDLHARTLHRTHNLQRGTPGRDYTGAGVNVSLVDDAAIADHIDIRGRLTTVGGTGGGGDHGDGTVGIVMGAGNLDPVRGFGQAPGVTMRYYDIGNSGYSHVNTAVANYNTFGTIATSTSYSEVLGGLYTTTANFVDNQVANQGPNIQHVFSAGNSSAANSPSYNSGVGGVNWGTITGGRKAAKSTIAVAALDYEDNIAGYSSRGPAADGRIKPDISSYGAGQISLAEAANTYQVFGGTSAACPGITGAYSVLVEAFRDHHGGQDPASGLLKGIMLNTADELGNPGPDFYYGWGRINALRAVRVIENNQFMADTVTHSGNISHSITVPPGVAEVKVMVYWNDQPGTVQSSRALVNDIDITLETPSASVFEPWVLDHRDFVSSLSANAVRGRDSVNNMEQVTLTNPSAGTYTLKVNGTDIPSGPQPYFVNYEFRYAKPEITYPAGNESMPPSAGGDFESIRWDAQAGGGNFDVFFSSDSGSSWSQIGFNLSGLDRSLDWIVPNIVTGNALIRIANTSSGDTSDATFSIIEIPEPTLKWECNDSFMVQWPTVPGATSYDVFLMGPMYMDSVGNTTDTSFIYRNVAPATAHFYSVSARGPSGRLGRRAVAESTTGTPNCPVAIDASLSEILSPGMAALPDCQTFDSLKVKVEIENAGFTDISGIQVSYQLNSGPVVTDTLSGVLPAFGVTTYEFPGYISFSSTMDDTLTAWVSVASDGQSNNDVNSQIYETYPSSTYVLGIPYVENFDLMSSCPTTNNCELTVCNLSNGWRNISNQVDDIDFRVNSGFTPSGGTGPSGDHTSGSGNYIYTEASFCFNRESILISPCIDMSFNTAPELRFWYNMRGAAQGALHLDLIVDGELIRDIMPPFQGDQGTGTGWREKVIDLTPYAGKVINLHFRALTGPDFTSDIALDDISITETAIFSQDLGITEIIDPGSNVIESCIVQDSIAVTAVIANLGALPSANFVVGYQLGSQAPATQFYSGLFASGAVDTISFNKRFAVPVTGTYELKVWHSYSLDQFQPNDTLYFPITVVQSTPVSVPAMQTMTSFGNCGTAPNCGGEVCALGSGWVNLSNGVEDDIDWRVDQNGTPSTGTGPSGDHTSGNGKYLYTEASGNPPCAFATAILESPCFDLSTLVDPKLRIWYHMLGADMGSLHFDVGLGGSWVEDFVPPISGNQGNSWQAWVIDLNFFASSQVKFRIRGVTGPGFESDIAIDDIEIYSGFVAPTADFNMASSTCRNATRTITDASSGTNLNYLWDFGPGSLPSNASTAGPHSVIFTQAGNIDVTLITTNLAGADTMVKTIYVDSIPTAGFSFTQFGDSLVFQNSALNFDSVIWDFGDGNSSVDVNPTHVYDTSGNYLITQRAKNDCGDDLQSNSVFILGFNSSNTLSSRMKVYPNPFENQIIMDWTSKFRGNGIVKIVDITGRTVSENELEIESGANMQTIDVSGLVSGTYFLMVSFGDESGVIKIEKL